MSDIKFGRYYFSNSIIHKMDAALKLICLLIYTIILFLSNNLFILTFLVSIIILLILLTDVPINLYIKSTKILLPIIIFIIIISFIFNTNIVYTTISILKLVLMILYSTLFMFTTTPKDITSGINKILKPFKVFNINPNKLSLSISLTIKFIPIILEQSNKILKSQSSRGLDFKNGDIKEKVKSLNSLMLPMLMLSLKRADDIADFMEVRLYDIDKNYDNNRKQKHNVYDLLMIILHIVIILAFIYWR